ncbi:ABC transporter permease [Kitasatospora cystarginea]|uniref:ABC transporter permease n=1 Tax=Kitasatospora cystarginea TaxID=58350 RepID=UPI0031D555BD
MLITSERHVVTPDRVNLKIVGYADSASQSAGGWVTPDQARTLHAASLQMMYRFQDAGSDAALKTDMVAATKGLPSNAPTGTSSYLAIKANLAKGPDTYVPFLTVFGVLGLIVSVLIVVSGAVVSGFRHIGVLKALGFTPNQVTADYLVMVTFPAAIGCALGSVLGSLVGKKLGRQTFWGIFGNDLVRDKATVPTWVYPVVPIGMPLLVALSAFEVSVLVSFTTVQARSAGSPAARMPQVRMCTDPAERRSAELESVLGVTPHEFESRILRLCPSGQTRGPDRTAVRSGPSSCRALSFGLSQSDRISPSNGEHQRLHGVEAAARSPVARSAVSTPRM